MQSLGFPSTTKKQYSMAVQDVSVEFARQMKDQHLSDLDTDKLIASESSESTRNMSRTCALPD